MAFFSRASRPAPGGAPPASRPAPGGAPPASLRRQPEAHTVYVTGSEAVSDLIVAGPEPVFFSDAQGNKGQSPLKLSQLKNFVDQLDLRKYGIDRNDTVCTAIANSPEAAVCFWAIANQAEWSRWRR